MIKYCQTCAIADLSKGLCRLTRLPIDVEDYCSRYISEIYYCDRCGTEFLPSSAVINDTEIICGNCAKLLGTCATCKNAQICEFRNNSDPMPQVVMQTVRQGNMIMQTQVKNPDRIAKFCPSCSCFSSEHGCLKEVGACAKWS